MDIYEQLKEKYDTRHGGPFDRGSADSYYHRGPNPHYFVGDTAFSPMIPEEKMTPHDVEAYMAGYKYNEEHGEKKQF